MSLLDQILRELGTTEAELSSGNSRVARLVQQTGVSDTEEFRRVRDLAERPANPEEDPNAVRLAELLTRKYGKGGMSLRPAQARALGDLADLGGCFGDLPVGSGKTLVSGLAPAVARAGTTLLLVPGTLREKTRRDFERLQVFWRLSEVVVMGYEEISRDDGPTKLRNIAPSLLICDECHKLKDPSTATTIRVGTFLADRAEAGLTTKILLMSGTVRSLARSLLDYWHLLKWALDEHAMPLPANRSEAGLWDRATSVRFEGARPNPGVLGGTAEEGREWIQQRISSAPGVTWSPAPEVKSNLRIRVFSPQLPQLLEDAIGEAERGKRADGESFDTEDDQLRALRQYPLGYFSRYKVPPTHPWRRARATWNWFVRDVCARGEPGLDTEMTVRRAAQAGKFGRCAAWDGWKDLRDIEPETEAVWLDPEWLPANLPSAPHLIWSKFRAPGYLLRHRGLRYYAENGLDQHGQFVEDDHGLSSVVLSQTANGIGRNLQGAWHRNLILTQTTNPGTYEQVIGRTYRPGQEEDTVYVTIFAPSARCRSTFWSAVNEAKQQGTGLLARADIE